MKFEINKNIWQIITLEPSEFYKERKRMAEEDRNVFQKNGAILGTTDVAFHIIYLNKQQHKDELRKTLIHELGHCWLWSNGASYTEYCEDALCDTISSSYYFIHDIVEKYFDTIKKE